MRTMHCEFSKGTETTGVLDAPLPRFRGWTPKATLRVVARTHGFVPAQLFCTQNGTLLVPVLRRRGRTLVLNDQHRWVYAHRDDGTTLDGGTLTPAHWWAD